MSIIKKVYNTLKCPSKLSTYSFVPIPKWIMASTNIMNLLFVFLFKDNSGINGGIFYEALEVSIVNSVMYT